MHLILSMSWNRANRREAQLSIENVMSASFYQTENNSYRVQASYFGGRPYVGLGKFYYQPDIGKWLPSKQHFNMPLEAWNFFVTRFDTISAKVNKLGLSGMITPV